jgi:hypothetical protein
MYVVTMFKKTFSLWALIFGFSAHAAVFNIIPKAGTTLPTQADLGGNVKAYYTVTNTTGRFHAGNYVKYLPPNTSQITDDNTISNLCGSTFQLAPGESCTLALNVKGGINANDPNPRNHLFVCLGGCVTCCAGTYYPLNVTVVTPIYTAIFDAGSSGTRLSFYKVIPGNGSYPLIEILNTFNGNTTGVEDNGINDFLNDQGSIVLSSGTPLPTGCPGTTALGQNDVEACVLQPLLDVLDSAVTNLNISRSEVKIELFATAGMRTEDERNGGGKTTTQIDEYYAQMKNYVTQWGYDANQFKTINGSSEEGVWTWVNFNDYYFNSFGGNPTVSQTVSYPQGDIEVGGSSMQIAFPINDMPSDKKNIYPVKINGHQFNVYSQSFLGLGADDARKFVKAYAYNDNDGGLGCYAATATASNTAEDSSIGLYPSDQVIYGTYPFPSNSNLGTPWTSLAPSALELQQTSPASDYDGPKCSNLYNITVNQVTNLTRNNYGTYNQEQTVTMTSLKAHIETSNAPFFGIAGFFYASKGIDYYPSTNFDSSAFQTNLNNYCQSQVADDYYAQANCPNATLMNTYLYGPSGLFSNGTASFSGVLSSVDASGDTILTWTRGYLLMKYA